ncbi:MAG: hypothetical protein IT163_00200 [Bryobacterales bacterium]|nr:hypothetical protein [Bryobacterales bacterium]
MSQLGAGQLGMGLTGGLVPGLALAVGTAGWRKVLAVGTGIGVELRPGGMRAVAVRVRPGGAELLGQRVIEGIQERPAVEWGAEFSAFARQFGAERVPAALLLPRQEVIVRHLTLAGVSEQDLPAAVAFQIEGLHPFPEDEAAWCWARLGTTPHVLVAIARQETVSHYRTMFAEAGIPVSTVTVSAAVLYTSQRLFRQPETNGFLSVIPMGEAFEVYGESPSRPVYSTLFDTSPELARRAALSELRLDPATEPYSSERLVPPPVRAREEAVPESLFAYAAALTSAVPGLSLEANLIPEAERQARSRLQYIPTAILLVLLAVAGFLLLTQESRDKARYLAELNTQITQLEKQARRAEQLDHEAADARARVALLDQFRRRTLADMEALREATMLISPPAWANQMVLSRTTLTLQGEIDQAAPLLQKFDQSPLFVNSDLAAVQPNQGGGEAFTLRSTREEAVPGAAK